MRFGPTERVYHWLQALPFLVLLVGGGLSWIQRLTGVVFVAQPTLAWIHMFAGCFLPVALLLTYVLGDRDALRATARQAVSWSRDDVRWLMRAPLCALGLRTTLPPAGRFNAGQKINLLAVMVLLPLFLVTGVLMWLWASALLPWFVHLSAFLLALPLTMGHLFLATIPRSTRRGLPGMLTGRVDADWAREHHPLAYPVHREPHDVAYPASEETASS